MGSLCPIPEVSLQASHAQARASAKRYKLANVNEDDYVLVDYDEIDVGQRV